MKFPAPVAIQWIAELIGAELKGNAAGLATGINEIHKVEVGDLVFVDHPKYYDKCINSAASFIIINKATDFPEGKALLIVDQPFEAYQTIVRHFRPFVHSTQMVSSSAKVGEGTWLAPNVFIGEEVSIGKNCRIFPGAVLGAVPQDLKYNDERTYVEIGDNTTIREFVTIHIRGYEIIWSSAAIVIRQVELRFHFGHKSFHHK